MTATSAERRSYGLFIGRPLGIPIYLSPSLVIFVLLVTVTVADDPDIDAASVGVRVSAGVIAAALLALSILLHELGHSAVALALRIPIRRITLFLFGGIAEITREPDTAAKEFSVSIAGPLMSLTLAAVFRVAWLESTGVASVVVFRYLCVMNLFLGMFNLLPGLPLDGGRVLRAVVWQLGGSRTVATRVAAGGGIAVAALLAALGAYLLMTGDGLAVFWLLIALFIFTGARGALTQAALAGRLPALTMRSLTRPALAVAADLPLAEALRRAAVDDLRLLVVDGDGAPSALISTAAVEAVPAERRPWVSIGSVSRSLTDGLVLDVELSGEEVLSALRATPASEYLVVDRDGGMVGVLAARDVARRLAPGKSAS